MNEKEFEKLIYKSIDKKIKNLKKLEWIFSSIIDLNEFEKKFQNKITSIKKISEVTNYNDLLQILKKNKIIKND